MTNHRIHYLQQSPGTICHIASIPPEVLTSIFIQVKTIDEIENPGDIEQLDWIRVTHVCRYWRDVGIRAQCLWTNIPLYSPKWTVEMLQRSKDMPIIVTADRYSRYKYALLPSDEAVQKMFEHFSRVQELNIINTTCHEARPYLDLKLPTHPPLRLHTVRFSGFPFGENHGGVICLKDETFFPHLDLSSLRRLVLKHCHLRWGVESGFLRNLTHIRFISDHRNNVLEGVEPFLDALRNMPALESLDFEYFADPHQDPQIHSLPLGFLKVPLRNLKILRLAVQMRQLELILEGLDVPSDVSMKLYCYERSASTSTFPNILSAYASHLHDGDITIRSLELLSNYTENLRIRIWPTVLSLESLNAMDKPPKMEAIFCWNQPIELTSEILFQHMLQCLNLEHLESLAITDLGFIDSNTWAKTFGALPKLSTIDLGISPIRGLLQALVHYTDNNEEDTTPKVAFPSLQSLSFSLWDIFFKDGLQRTQQLILETVSRRLNLGLEIHRIIFKNTESLSRKIMDQIREIVPKVENIWTIPDSCVAYEAALNAYCYHGRADLDETDALMGVWR